MIVRIFGKVVEQKYSYEDFLRDFKIHSGNFYEFLPTGHTERILTSARSSDFNEMIEVKVSNLTFSLYLKDQKLNQRMDVKYGDNYYLYQGVTAQTFIICTGLLLNKEFNLGLKYKDLDNLYKSMTKRKDKKRQPIFYKELLNNIEVLVENQRMAT